MRRIDKESVELALACAAPYLLVLMYWLRWAA